MLDFSQFEVLSFDCYGTLIDWEGGILPVLKNLLETHNINQSDKQILELFAEFESELEKDTNGYLKYREVLRQVVKKISERFNFDVTEAELNSLPDSLKNWQPFPDTVEALKALKKRFHLAIISNTDDELFADTAKHLQVEFDWIITAEQVKSYKPSPRNFEFAIQKMGISPDKLLHVAESIYHDVIPVKAMGLSTVWVNRRVGKEGFGATKAASGEADLEVPDLKTLVSLI
ncbi:haloacid dehalogenase type II [Kamptonema sp. UHCC 0994]|uniref:haloacid dehalogenase type II n=1 Tax=Kamptonema sp. UHCC 0994 TaxID=3031329 RepID=UPI0023B9843B|nr:haloacid dehalogenase type II [Kamptonema sp. UHCC 0994]MDF0555843.1 haloacid dehalogenase type II [Kamptonema sp. UHCC 0994]